jgi:hypothetical protein
MSSSSSSIINTVIQVMPPFHCFVGTIARRNSAVVRLGDETQAVRETDFVCNPKREEKE